ncbi:MAG: SRPBCC family protein [Gemmatimonadaceae bacterium]
MTTYSVSSSASVRAPAALVYSVIADYHDGHPLILPPKYFRNLRVEAGGVGAGTRISFEMGAFGTWRTVTGEVTEPEPGRLLHEYYADSGILTAFLVEPTSDGACEVTFTSTLPRRRGMAGALERLTTTAYLRRVYRDELAMLALVAVARA